MSVITLDFDLIDKFVVLFVLNLVAVRPATRPLTLTFYLLKFNAIK